MEEPARPMRLWLQQSTTWTTVIRAQTRKGKRRTNSPVSLSVTGIEDNGGGGTFAVDDRGDGKRIGFVFSASSLQASPGSARVCCTSPQTLISEVAFSRSTLDNISP